MIKYKLVTITNNLPDYPEHKEDTESCQYLVEEVEDEVDSFIIREDGEWWPANEFFQCEDIKEFVKNA